jgi:hypothetical protein
VQGDEGLKRKHAAIGQGDAAIANLTDSIQRSLACEERGGGGDEETVWAMHCRPTVCWRIVRL